MISAWRKFYSIDNVWKSQKSYFFAVRLWSVFHSWPSSASVPVQVTTVATFLRWGFIWVDWCSVGACGVVIGAEQSSIHCVQQGAQPAWHYSAFLEEGMNNLFIYLFSSYKFIQGLIPQFLVLCNYNFDLFHLFLLKSAKNIRFLRAKLKPNKCQARVFWRWLQSSSILEN